MSISILNKRRVYHAKAHGKDGNWNFNCWGATLFALNQIDRLEWIECRRMMHWLSVSTGEIYRPARPGDIVSVWRWGELRHTAVYLGRGRYFHKRGPSSAEITDLAGVRKTYRGEYKWHRLSQQIAKEMMQ